MSGFKKFTSLESFAHVYRGQDYFDHKATVKFGAKIKLHGTNAAVRVTKDGEVFAQSRSRDITVDADNSGFAHWVSITHDQWAFPPSEVMHKWGKDVIYYGEWAGKGIQKGDAVCNLDDKYFFIFAVYDEGTNTMIVDPAAIEATVPDLDQVVVLPWDCIWSTPVNFADSAQCEKFVATLNEGVTEIGKQDPFIHGIFGVDGPGEGWVVSPVLDPFTGETAYLTADTYNRFTFKVKTEAHSVKNSKPASKNIEVPEGVDEFVAMFVTPARCAQGVYEVVGYADAKFTGDFLKWMGQDIKKESIHELADAGLEWKDVQKHVMKAARAWWLIECETLT